MKTSKSVKTSVVAVCAAMMLMNPVCASAAELADETAPEAEVLPTETQPAEALTTEVQPAEAVETPADAAAQPDALSEDAATPAPDALPADTTAQPDVLPEDAVTPDAAQQDAFALQIESVDSETAVILAEQMKVQQQGYALDQYHRINILGDSLTEGVGARTPDKAFPAVLAKLTGAKVNNYGVSGSRITDIVVDYTNPGSFVDRMYSMDKAADLVIVFGGTNDFWFGDCPIGKRTDSKPNTFYGALNTMIPYLKNAYAADLIFIVPYQQSKDADETHSYKRSTYGNYGTGTLNQYRIAMLDRCQYYGVPVLDLYADYDLNTADNREALEKYGNFICDGCHLNDAGYNLLARKLYQFIMQDFSQYVPAYTTINDMVFETAALPSLIQDGNFVMPNGQVIPAKEGFAADPAMPLQQLYQNLIVSAMY